MPANFIAMRLTDHATILILMELLDFRVVLSMHEIWMELWRIAQVEGPWGRDGTIDTALSPASRDQSRGRSNRILYQTRSSIYWRKREHRASSSMVDSKYESPTVVTRGCKVISCQQNVSFLKEMILALLNTWKWLYQLSYRRKQEGGRERKLWAF